MSYFSPQSVLCSAVSVFAMFFGLTVYACFMSDDDMPVIGGLLTSLLLVMIPVMVFCILFPSLLIYMILQGVFVVLTSIYIVLDTRFIL